MFIVYLPGFCAYIILASDYQPKRQLGQLTDENFGWQSHTTSQLLIHQQAAMSTNRDLIHLSTSVTFKM